MQLTPMRKGENTRNVRQGASKEQVHLSKLPWSLALRRRKQQNFLFFLSSFNKSATVTPQVEHRQFHYHTAEGSKSNANKIAKHAGRQAGRAGAAGPSIPQRPKLDSGPHLPSLLSWVLVYSSGLEEMGTFVIATTQSVLKNLF